MKKNKKENLSDAREAFLKFREEISKELGVFVDEAPQSENNSYRNTISARMRAREKKHQRKNK